MATFKEVVAVSFLRQTYPTISSYGLEIDLRTKRFNSSTSLALMDIVCFQNKESFRFVRNTVILFQIILAFIKPVFDFAYHVLTSLFFRILYLKLTKLFLSGWEKV